jgi:hypothetical protein
MEINLVNFIRDVLVIGYMFVLRIGVPLLIVVMWGAALKKWLYKPIPETIPPTLVQKQELDEPNKLEDFPAVVQ